MWLRDSLPKDLPSLRVLIYGYDTRLEKSQSFQNTYDLGLQLRNSIQDIRNYDSVRLLKYYLTIPSAG
jgi:hypothetical protein